MVPGETVDSVLGTMNRALSEALPGDEITVSVAEEEGVYEPAEILSDCATVKLMSRCLLMFEEKVDLFGTPYSSDVRHLVNAAGIEAVTIGPGRFSEMHARDEFIRIDDLVRAARSLAAFSALNLSGS